MSQVINLNRKTHILILFGLWIFATAMNLNKAYHIDDTAHLEVAQWILENPLHPMSGPINWSGNTEPISTLNQPHLYFYLLAAWGYIFGFSEIYMHFFQSFFTFACILLIYLIAKILVPRRALFLTVLLSVSPAFVVGQNLMVDVPLLSLWLAFYYILINPGFRSETTRLVLAGFMAGCALLVKYSCLPMIVVMFAYIILKRKHNLVWTLCIPTGILILWSCFNYFDYGSIHILDRPAHPVDLGAYWDSTLAWLVALGSILPYSPLFFANVGKTKNKWHVFIQIALILILFSLALVFWAAYFHRVNDSTVSRYLQLLSLGNGMAATLFLLYTFISKIREFSSKEAGHSILLLFLWFLSEALFVIMFAPFMATRHILIVIVPITLLLAHFIETHRSFFWSGISFMLCFFLTLALGISDRIWADYYKEKAALIRKELPHNATIYFTGHWGWQWYAKKNGMQQLEASVPQIGPGDYLAEGIERQALIHDIARNLRFQRIKVYSEPPSILTFFKTDQARFYNSSFHFLPWVVNCQPFDKIVVWQVKN